MSARTILLVGDDACYLRMLAYELTRAGYAIADETSAPDCAVVDLERAEPPAGLPAIGYARADSRDDRNAACAVLLRRPFAIPDLLDALAGLDRPDPRHAAEARRLHLDDDARTVTHSGRRLALMPAEFALLRCLLDADGAPVSRAALIAAMPSGNTPASNLTEVTICALRRKLETAFGLRPIRTVRGVGYRWVSDDGMR